MGSDHEEKGEIIMHGIEIQILEQKLDINNKMPKLKETEFLAQQTCKCGGWCAISHSKHSWKVTKSEHVYKMMCSLNLNLVA